MLPLLTLTPHPVLEGKIEARAQQLGLGRSASPGLGLAGLSICVILGKPRPDKHGGQSSALVGKNSLEVSRPIPFPEPGPQSRQGWGQRESGMAKGQARPLQAGLEGWGGRTQQVQRLTDAQECGASPQVSPGMPKGTGQSTQRGAMPGTQHSAAAGLEPLCSREPHEVLQPGLVEKLFWRDGGDGKSPIQSR